MRATIVIPSYWTRESSESLNLNDAVYDHPTPLDTGSTLDRALESIDVLENRDFNVIVLACATNPDIYDAVERHVNDIAAKHRSKYPVKVISHSFESKARARIAAEAGDDVAELISLTGYSNIRNMCLVAAELARSEVAVLFDDDEVYEDSKYLDKVFETIDSEYGGKPVRVVAGYYQQPDGSYLLPPPEEYWMTEWPMVPLMNEAFKIIGEEPRVKLTPFVFGGNMVIHRDIFRTISFDPNVRRGEDMDYLTNCKFFDIDFVLDRELAIKHLPPPKTHVPPWQHFRENIYRFVYAREKIRRQAPGKALRMVDISELDPYPGRCMRDNLEDMIFKTSVLMGLMYGRLDDQFGFNESMKNIQLARYDAPPGHDPFEWYIECRSRWEKLMELLSADDALSKDVLSGL